MFEPFLSSIDVPVEVEVSPTPVRTGLNNLTTGLFSRSLVVSACPFVAGWPPSPSRCDTAASDATAATPPTDPSPSSSAIGEDGTRHQTMK